MPLISLAENCEQRLVAEPTTNLVLKSSFNSTFGKVTLRLYKAPISLATLKIDNKSGLLDKTDKFKTTSSKPK